MKLFKCLLDAINRSMIANCIYNFYFQDLKNYQYHYWFGFPALMPEKPVEATPPVCVKSCFSEEQVNDNHYQLIGLYCVTGLFDGSKVW